MELFSEYHAKIEKLFYYLTKRKTVKSKIWILEVMQNMY